MKFQMPTRIIFESGSFGKVAEIVNHDLKAARCLLVTDKGIRDSGIADRIIAELAGIEVFDEVEQNPKHPTVDRGGELARRLRPDLVIGLGGGSALDAAKAIALLAANPGKIENYEGRRTYAVPPLPVLAIPTTCGTGSEVTWVAVITHTGRRFKMSIKGPEMFPRVALVDPDLLKTLPPPLVASTGLDALTHAIEAYTVKPATLLTDIFAKESLHLIFTSLDTAFKDIRSNNEARKKIMLGSTLAGIAFGNSDVGAVHCIAEAVGSLYDTPHGVANAIFLPFVMEFNLCVSSGRYAEIAKISGIQAEDDQSAALELIKKIKNLSRSLNIPSFRDLKIPESRLQEIAQKSFANNSNPSNPREAGINEYLGLLERAYHEP